MFRKKIITREDGTPYLERTYIIKTKLFQIVLHKILQSDLDCLHDHQWNFISIILKGGYYEGTNADQVLKGPELDWYKIRHKNDLYNRWFGAGSVLYRKAEWKHKLTLEKYRPNFSYATLYDIEEFKKLKHMIPCTTLVIMFKRRREWGFWTKKGFVKWFDYNSKSNCE